MTTTTQCHGYTAPGFESVREAFDSNLRTGEELGGSVAVYHRGELVVDLWGGALDTDGTAYPEDALHVGYSVTKGVMGLVLAHLVDSGEVELDAPVAAYWPEFAAAGKGAVRLQQVTSHQAGLVAFDEPATVCDLADWQTCTQRLAAQQPRWTPGSAHGYHALTLGYLVGEVIRRATGRSVGQLLRERFDDGHLDAWIGLPDQQAHRVVRARPAAPTPGVGAIVERVSTDPLTLTHAAFNNPEITLETFNEPTTWWAEIPAANGVFDARSLARLYSRVVEGPLRSVSERTVDQVRRPVVHGPDLVLPDQPTRFGTVFMLSSPRQPMLGPGSLGHDGMGGPIAFAHPESGLAFAYLTNRAVGDPSPHPRVSRLVAAVAAAM